MHPTNNISTGSNANCLLVYALETASTSEDVMGSIRLAGNLCRDFKGEGVRVRSGSTTIRVRDVEIDDNTFEASCDQASCSALVFVQDTGGQGTRDIRLTANRFVVGVRTVRPIVVFEHVQGVVAKGNTLTGLHVKPFSFPVPGSGAVLWESNWALRYDDLSVLAANGVAPGSLAYCLDCKRANPCAGGGLVGALAKRIGAQWLCD